jgi:hypothetical protein
MKKKCKKMLGILLAFMMVVTLRPADRLRATKNRSN